MKVNHLKIGLIILLATVGFSCNDEFMERYPLDQLTSETYWNTENDLIVYNNYLYNLAMNDENVPIMMGHHNRTSGNANPASDIWFLDFYSDNYNSLTVSGASAVAREDYSRICAGKHIVPTNPTTNGWMGWTFVRACNFGLANYNRANLSQATINRYIAEARLFRGWFFADKVSKFGNIPYFEKELNIDSEELFGERMPREEAMEHILADLTFACENLPADWGDGNAPGRLNRWCALLVKSRICLFEGTWRKYHGGTNPNHWLQEAANATRELINNGPYKVHTTGNPDHDYNFVTSRLDDGVWKDVIDMTGNAEVMYWRRYVEGINYFTASYFFGYAGANKSFVEDYLCTDGLPITLSPLYRGDATYEDIWVDRDPRLRQTILHPDDVNLYQYGNQNNYIIPRLPGLYGSTTGNTGYHIIKDYNGRNSGAVIVLTPAITLRLGEALLIYAEAMAELGTISQADLDMSINKLRDRVGMPHLTLTPPMDPRYANDGVSSLIVEIRRERRIELFMEGQRYDDLRRWKQGKKLEIRRMGIRWDDAYKERYDPDNQCVMSTTNDPVTGIPYIDIFKNSEFDNPVFDENKHYLWPIPLNTLSMNPGLKQNPGWQ